MVNPNNNIPKITTRQTEYLRDQYPNLSHLEAGNIAEWLQERKDQLFEQARSVENEADTARVLGLAAAGIGTVCYALNPFMLIGGMIGGAAWLWFVVEHHARTKEIAPLPFVRGNFLDTLSRAGDYDARQNYQADHLANTIKFLPRHDAEEYVFLYSDQNFERITDYLIQVEPGKRFYAYRWLLGWFSKLGGRSLPDQQSMVEHLAKVEIDSRVKVEEVKAIQRSTGVTTVNIFADMKPGVSVTPSSPQLSLTPEKPTVQKSPVGNETKLNAVDVTPSEQQTQETALTSTPNKEAMLKLPLQQRATAIAACLIESGFKIDEVMNGQVIAVAGTQRGGKGTLAGILTILSKSLDPNLNVQYFTAGVDVYPFKCNLNSALQHSTRDGDEADRKVGTDLLLFLKGLESCEPYSHKNLVLIIDEAMRLLSLVKEEDRVWAIQYLLSRFAKTGGTLIIVLHSNNLGAVVGSKNTSGLADTFKQSISFIGCVAQSVSAGGLRKINVASGEYFKANPENFGSAIANGELGSIPDWLLTEKHPGNGYPDPVRSLLTFFPELYEEPPIQVKSKDKLSETIQKLEASFNIEVEEPKTESIPILEDSSSTVIQPTAPELTSHEQQLLSWIVTRKTTGKEYDLNSANKNLEKLVKPDDFDSKAEYLRHLMRQLASKKKGKLINPNLFEPN